MMNNPIPNPDLVGDLFWGIFKPQWIRLALTLDIFTPFNAKHPHARQADRIYYGGYLKFGSSKGEI